LAARRDCPDQHAVAHGVARDARAELFDDADRLVADHQSRADGVLAAQDVEVGSADRGQRDANDRVADARPRAFHLLHTEIVRAVKHGRAHRRHGYFSWIERM
jgi:hypothetical protein